MTAVPRPASERASRHFRPEIQALRAVAVMLVVLYHFWPGTVAGGYVGVDAFFVISGYLITSHLLREAEATGTVKLSAFYARRARRLLPASILVLVFVAAATYLLLPTDLWAATAHEVTASGFYVQNLWLASKAVTYSASNDVASPVTHYWSLSAEEQFYLLWPTLVIISCLLARGRLRRTKRTRPTSGISGIDGTSALSGISGFSAISPTVRSILLLVTAGSFALSVWATRTHPAAAYFITPTRAWEFGAGGLVVLLLRRWAPSRSPARLLRWLGLGGLLASAWFFSGATAFPGYAAALPVVATAAIIVAGDTGRGDPLDPVLRLRAVQWLGDVSYSVYLWHWPLLVFAPYVLRHSLRTPELMVLLAICLVVSGLSKHFVEDVTRLWPRVTASPRATLSAAAAAMVVIAVVSGTQVKVVGVRERQNVARLAEISRGPCFGAAAMEDRVRCPEALTALPVVSVGKADAPWAPEQGCHGAGSDPSVLTCYWGMGRPSRVVALVGDSHAEHWRGALHRIAKARNWQIHEMFAGGCPATDARSVTFDGRARDGEACRTWTRKATAKLRVLAPDDIITTAYVQQNAFDPVGSGPAGFERVWRQWLGFSRVSVLRDIPTTANRNDPQCLAVHIGDPQACANARSTVLVDDDMMRAARKMSGAVSSIDLSRYFCDARRCYAVIGGASVYYDHDHLSRQFSASLSAALLKGLPKA